jgi:hypothetical protein
VVYQIELANSHLMPSLFLEIAVAEMSDSLLVLSQFSQKQTKLIPSGNTSSAVVFIGVS